MIDLKKRITSYNNIEEYIKKLQKDLNYHKERKKDEENIISLLERMIAREISESNEYKNEFIAKVRLKDLIDELTSLTGVTEYKIFVNLSPQKITGNFTKEELIRKELKHFNNIHLYIKGIEKTDDNLAQTYFKYEMKIFSEFQPVIFKSLTEIQGNGKQLIDCCNIVPKQSQYINDNLGSTSLIIVKEQEKDIICNITVEAITELKTKITEKELELLNKAINNCIEKHDYYSYPKQLRKDK